MTNQRQKLGQKGEELALELLEKKGQTILEKNYRNLFGEIDIIAKDHECLCFVEVRTKSSVDQGHPFESITYRKQRKIVQVASHYLQLNDLNDVQVRFDVMAVIPQNADQFQLEYIQNAFDAKF